MTSSPPRLGTLAWVERTGGQLTLRERRALIHALARMHASSVRGRTAQVLRLNSGRKNRVPADAMRLPTSALTATAEQEAAAVLSPAMLQHSYRTYLFGSAVAHLQHVDVDREVLFAAAMLHGIGLMRPVADVDCTLAGATAALRVAEAVGLSTAATQVLRNAICLHHSPDVTLAVDGAVAYLLAVGAALDTTGYRSWLLPRALLGTVTADYSRRGFRNELAAAIAAESAAVPNGRVRLLRRYGALDLAIRHAPFAG